MGFESLLDRKENRYFLSQGKPDPSYDLNCYPAKMYAALARGFVRYAETCPGRRDELLLTARRCCDHLISISQPKDAPLANFPPTYLGENYTSKQYNGMNMLDYPAGAGSAYLKLEEATGDPAYLQAAEKIGQYYLNTVQPNGSWFLIVSLKDGAPVSGAYCLPLEVIVPFLKRLAARPGDSRYDRLAAGNTLEFKGIRAAVEGDVGDEHHVAVARKRDGRVVEVEAVGVLRRRRLRVVRLADVDRAALSGEVRREEHVAGGQRVDVVAVKSAGLAEHDLAVPDEDRAAVSARPDREAEDVAKPDRASCGYENEAEAG